MNSSTLDMLKQGTDNLKHWKSVTLVTNLIDCDEVNAICKRDGVNATIMVRVNEEDVIEYHEVTRTMKRIAKRLFEKLQKKNNQ